MKEVWDAIIVGAGPAGSVAARELGQRGCSVLLVDKATFPRRKVCGCCLNENALTALAGVGLGHLTKQLGAVPLSKVVLGAGGRIAELAVRGVSLSREAFDMALIHEAIEAGVMFLPGVRAVMGAVEADMRLMNLDGKQVRARVVIAADGLNGRLAPAAEGFDVPATATARIGAGVALDNAPSSYRQGKIYMATGPGGYVGLVRLEDDRLDIAAAFDATFVRTAGGLGAAAACIIHEAGLPAISGIQSADWKGTPLLTRRPQKIAGERWFAVGDASGYVEPFTGEGMAWAIGAAANVAPLAIRAMHDWQPRLVNEWTRSHFALVGKRQRVCQMVARVLRSPTLCKLAVRAARLVPSLAVPLVAAINRPAKI